MAVPKSLGVSSVTPRLLGGVVTLLYTAGPVCHAGAPNESVRKTLIVFECNATAGAGTPQFVDETDDCTYVFKWATAVVCTPSKTQVPCLVRDLKTGNQYDLGVLARTSGTNWVVGNSQVR